MRRAKANPTTPNPNQQQSQLHASRRNMDKEFEKLNFKSHPKEMRGRRMLWGCLGMPLHLLLSLGGSARPLFLNQLTAMGRSCGAQNA